ncbi:MAG: hypothetical protein J3K34DRAFT_30029 [Monoraphidium minutum]|nr:MAG: hypothetical protein J3K34DRAFT_30029 [Monoraphidium minutum]
MCAARVRPAKNDLVPPGLARRSTLPACGRTSLSPPSPGCVAVTARVGPTAPGCRPGPLARLGVLVAADQALGCALGGGDLMTHEPRGIRPRPHDASCPHCLQTVTASSQRPGHPRGGHTRTAGRALGRACRRAGAWGGPIAAPPQRLPRLEASPCRPRGRRRERPARQVWGRGAARPPGDWGEAHPFLASAGAVRRARLWRC